MSDLLDGFQGFLGDVLLLLACWVVAIAAALALAWVICAVFDWIDRP